MVTPRPVVQVRAKGLPTPESLLPVTLPPEFLLSYSSGTNVHSFLLLSGWACAWGAWVNGVGMLEGISWGTVGMMLCWCWEVLGSGRRNKIAFVFNTTTLPVLLCWQ